VLASALLYTHPVSRVLGDQRRLPFYLDHHNYVKMAAAHFYLQSGDQKSRKICGEKGSEGLWGFMMQKPVLLNPKFGTKYSRIFPP
jgi:hypothetical protein